MKWYYESSHYTKELGNMVLDLVLNYPDRNNNIPQDFGLVINQDNLESHLQRIHVEQNNYHSNFPEEIVEIEQIAKKS